MDSASMTPVAPDTLVRINSWLNQRHERAGSRFHAAIWVPVHVELWSGLNWQLRGGDGNGGSGGGGAPGVPRPLRRGYLGRSAGGTSAAPRGVRLT